MAKARAAVLLLALGVVHSTAVHAQWQLDGTGVCTAAVGQSGVVAASDGAGGAFVVWEDSRAGALNTNIYAQRIDALGAAQWTLNGVPLCTAANSQLSPVITTDGAGGAIVAWQDHRAGNFDIYAQRINASGTVQWASDGVVLSAGASDQDTPTIVSDGAGGAIVTWFDYRSSNADVYAQRVNASGAVQWLANGVPVCIAANDQVYPTIATDGASGAIVTWNDFRGGTGDIYAQGLDGSGAIQWTLNGVPVCTATNNQYYPVLVSDGAHGAIITWLDYRSGGSFDIYAQRVNSSGGLVWAANGIPISTPANDQTNATIVPDGAGGAIIAWSDIRNGTDDDIYAQRVDPSGTTQWKQDGAAVCTASGNQLVPQLASDGAGGAVIAWQDSRSGNDDIYAQRVSAGGAMQWSSGGVPVSTEASNQTAPMIAGDGAGDVIVPFVDNRTGTLHIYAQRVEGRYGYWGHPEPTLTASKDYPDDQGGKVILSWIASGRDVLNQQVIYRYTVWRAMDAALVATLGTDGLTMIDKPVTAGTPDGARVVWHERTATSDYYWELVGTQEAYYYANYSFTAPTRQDSTATNPATQYFRVAAEGYNQFYNWPSNILTAHSVDNLAPAAPLYLTAQRDGADVDLKWNGVHAHDLKNYAVYRATSSGVTPVPGNFLADDTDTLLVDVGAPLTSLYYIVTAYDVHQNQSQPSNEAAVLAPTAVGDTPAITVLTVLPNYPNPFAGETDLEIGLPEAGAIRLEVYDVAGRRVRTMEVAGVKGWQKVPFSGIDNRGEPLASGVYFYKVHAAGKTLTRKMLITR